MERRETVPPQVGADSVGQRYPTVFERPITPSPIMIIVSKDSLSFIWVSLKLSIRQTDDIETMMIGSTEMTIHQTMCAFDTEFLLKRVKVCRQKLAY